MRCFEWRTVEGDDSLAPAQEASDDSSGEEPLSRGGFFVFAAVLAAPMALMLVALAWVLPEPIHGTSDLAVRALLILFEVFVALVIVSLWFRVRAIEEPSLEKAWLGRARALRVALIVVMLALIPALAYSKGDNAGPLVVYVYALIGVPVAIAIVRRRRSRAPQRGKSSPETREGH